MVSSMICTFLRILHWINANSFSHAASVLSDSDDTVTKPLASSSQGIFDVHVHEILTTYYIETLPEQCTDSDAGKSYFDGCVHAKSFSPSVYYFDGFRNMDRYQKFGPFYFVYYASVRIS